MSYAQTLLLVSKVTSFVVLHISLGPEALSTALGAWKRTLVSVDPLVDFEILLLTESLVAAGERALEGLGALV